jgi:hypothetical protein
MNQTKVSNRIGRKVQTRTFESLEVAVEYEDVIEWKNIEERQEKIDKVNQLAIINFKGAFDSVKEQFGLSERPVAITNTLADGTVKHASAESEADKTETKVPENFFDRV